MAAETMPGFTTNELHIRLRCLLQDVFDDRAFFAFPFKDMGDLVLPIICHVEHRVTPTPATTGHASLDTVIETVGAMLREPRLVEPRRYGPPCWASFFDLATHRVLKASGISS